jgi:hypothetical protein
MSQNRSRNRSVRDLRVRFGINTYRKFRSGFTESSGPHRKFRSQTGSTVSLFSRKTVPSSANHRKFPSRTGSTDRKIRSPNRYFLGDITPSSEPQIWRSIYVFRPSQREEHNGEVRYTQLHKMNIFGCQQVSSAPTSTQLRSKFVGANMITDMFFMA